MTTAYDPHADWRREDREAAAVAATVPFAVGDVVIRRSDCLAGVVEEIHDDDDYTRAFDSTGTLIGVRLPDECSGYIVYGIPDAFRPFRSSALR